MTEQKKTLIPLDEYNKNARERILSEKQPIGNGLACPDCGKELCDTHPNELLTSYPAQKRVGCKNCGYAGYRIA